MISSEALDTWRTKFAGREDSLDATWELAAIEEQCGDTLFESGEKGSRAHYMAAQRALIPRGTIFSSREENDRRMEAYTRLTNKLYEIGGDGRRRGWQPPSPPEPPPPPPRPVEKAGRAERRATVQNKARKRERRDTELGLQYHAEGHFGIYELARKWFDAAKALAPNYPDAARTACQWSRHCFERYNDEWTAHLPASRWDSDGGQELSEVVEFQNSLGTADAAPPAWAELFLKGEVRRAVRALEEPPPEFQPLAALLATARHFAGL